MDQDDKASVNQESDEDADSDVSMGEQLAEVEQEPDEEGDMIVRSRRYKQALTGAKVHDASMQTSRLGGVV